VLEVVVKAMGNSQVESGWHRELAQGLPGLR
jgi:hypothetical protein